MLSNVKYSILYFSVYQNMQNCTITLEEGLMVSYKTKPYKYDHSNIYIDIAGACSLTIGSSNSASWYFPKQV